MKECSGCHQQLPLEEFHRASKGSRGRGAYCKECQRARCKAWRQNRAVTPLTEGVKTCSDCREVKKVTEFYKGNAGSGGRQSCCKACQRAKSLAWKKANPERHKTTALAYEDRNKDRRKDQRLLRQHGITLELFNAMLASQRGICSICGKTPKKFDVDHDHVTGVIRGLLCNSCNQGLGYFHDDIEAMRSAITYLEAVRDRES